MPDPTYVEVQSISVKTSLDAKLRSAAAGGATRSLNAAIRSAKSLTDKPPKDKGRKGYTIGGTLTIALDDKSGMLAANAEIFVAVWPGQSIKARLNGGAKMPDVRADKLREKDVEFLVGDLVDDLMARRAVPFMEKTLPE